MTSHAQGLLPLRASLGAASIGFLGWVAVALLLASCGDANPEENVYLDAVLGWDERWAAEIWTMRPLEERHALLRELKSIEVPWSLGPQRERHDRYVDAFSLDFQADISADAHLQKVDDYLERHGLDYVYSCNYVADELLHEGRPVFADVIDEDDVRLACVIESLALRVWVAERFDAKLHWVQRRMEME